MIVTYPTSIQSMISKDDYTIHSWCNLYLLICRCINLKHAKILSILLESVDVDIDNLRHLTDDTMYVHNKGQIMQFV